MTNAPLRILHTESSTGWGGQEIRILSEAQGMRARGHAVSLLTPASADIYGAAQRRGIPVYPLPMEKKTLRALAAMTRWLARHAREYDVINTHSSTDAWLVALAGLAIRDMPPVVRTRHVSTAIGSNRATRWLYLRASRHVVTTGEVLRRQLTAGQGLPPAQTTSVRTGIDLSMFRPLDQGVCRAALRIAARPTLGILATLRDWKGHDYLLDAWRELRAPFPEWQLLVIGDGPQRARLEARVRAEFTGDSVRFVGNREDVATWLNALDLFALPSYGDEGVPQGIMQAMACGLAVVATPVGAIEEAVQREQTGIIVEPRNAADLAHGLARLMGDPVLRKNMGAAGLRYARENFGIEIMLDRMEHVFRTATARA